MRKTVLVMALTLVVAATATAQTKFSGKLQCDKPEQQLAVPVGDAPGHVLMLAHNKCTWSEGDLGGAKMESGEDTFGSEVHGNVSSEHGYSVVTVAGGDKAFVRVEGKTNMKDQKPSDGKGTWSFAGGTGKLKGLKGKGTYEGTFNAEGLPSWTVEGEYTIPAPAAKAPAKK